MQRSDAEQAYRVLHDIGQDGARPDDFKNSHIDFYSRLNYRDDHCPRMAVGDYLALRPDNVFAQNERTVEQAVGEDAYATHIMSTASQLIYGLRLNAFKPIDDWGFDIFRFTSIFGNLSLGTLFNQIIVQDPILSASFDALIAHNDFTTGDIAKFWYAASQWYGTEEQGVIYHNYIHACDVMLNTYYFWKNYRYKKVVECNRTSCFGANMSNDVISGRTKHDENFLILIALLSAGCHDIGHMGWNNAYELHLQHDDFVSPDARMDLASKWAQYVHFQEGTGDVAGGTQALTPWLPNIVGTGHLEYNHSGITLFLMNKFHIYALLKVAYDAKINKGLEEDIAFGNKNVMSSEPRCNEFVKKCILATVPGYPDDPHQPQLDGWKLINDTRLPRSLSNVLKPYNDGSTVWEYNDVGPENIYEFIATTIHAGDIANSIKPFSLGAIWIEKVYGEFQRQGDFERKANNHGDGAIKVGFLGSKYTSDISKNQLGYTKTVLEFYKVYFTNLKELTANGIIKTTLKNIELWTEVATIGQGNNLQPIILKKPVEFRINGLRKYEKSGDVRFRRWNPSEKFGIFLGDLSKDLHIPLLFNYLNPAYEIAAGTYQIETDHAGTPYDRTTSALTHITSVILNQPVSTALTVNARHAITVRPGANKRHLIWGQKINPQINGDYTLNVVCYKIEAGNCSLSGTAVRNINTASVDDISLINLDTRNVNIVVSTLVVDHTTNDLTKNWLDFVGKFGRAIIGAVDIHANYRTLPASRDLWGMDQYGQFVYMNALGLFNLNAALKFKDVNITEFLCRNPVLFSGNIPDTIFCHYAGLEY